MAKKRKKVDGVDPTSGLPIVEGLGNEELDPISNLPNEDIKPPIAKQYRLPEGDWDMSDIVNEQTRLDFGNNRYNRPTVFPGNIYDNEDIDWDVKDYGDINRQLHRDQTGWQRFGGFLNQAVVGEIIGGTIEGFGALIDAMDGDLSEDFSHPVAAFGNDIREWAREKTPIYLKPTSDKFRWGDGDWWASNGVSVVSSISMFLPGRAAVKGVGAVGGGLRRLNAATKGLKGAKTNAAIANSLNLSRTAKWLSNSTIMGLSSRHMENYREAAETFKVGYDKNFEYLGNPEKLDAYLKSADGQSMLDKLGLTRDSRNLRETAAKHIAGKSAAKSYNMNYANLGFDIAQSALFFRGVGRSTRAGIFGHSKPVKGAQNAILKNPKLPKTRFGKVLAATPRTRHWAFWSGTEGVEEMWNFVSMQEGIHYGDVLAGNTGWENRDFIDGTFADRLNRYANDGEMWTAAFMGAIGGGIFTGVSSWKNAKAQKARDAEAIKEINNRVDVLRESLKKRQKAEQRGDTNGMKEQDELLALEMALNAARTGTTDLLVDMLGDPIYEELLGEYGISGDQVASNRQALIDTILKTEKKFNKYVNKITGKKYSYGVANALTNMDMAVDIYQNLINSVEDQINNLDESDAFTQKQFGIGPNTKKRYELKAKREAIQAQIDQLNFARQQAATESTNPDTEADQSRKEALETMSFLDKLIEKAKQIQAETEAESTSLAKDSQDSYDAKALEAENKFLNEVNTDTKAYLEQRKGQFEANRDAAWTALQDMLNGKREDNDKVEQAFSEETEKDRVKRAIAEGREDVASSAASRAEEAINNGIKEDFRALLNENPNITEQQIKEFFAEYMNNPVIAEYAKKVLDLFINHETKRAYAEIVEEMRAEAAELKDEISDDINKSFADLHEELFNPKISRREQARRTAIEQEQRENKAEWNKGMYGEKSSQDFLLTELFDNLTKYVSVVWGDKVGMIYMDNGELIFREGESNKEYIISQQQDNKVFRNSKGQFTNGPTLGYLDMLLLRDANLDINIEADGKTFNINGEFYNNLYSDPSMAIEYDKDANVVSVTLDRWDGKKITFTSPAITYEIADVIETLEAVKRTRFRELVQDDFMIVDYQEKEYILSYVDGSLVARDLNGQPLKTDNLFNSALNESVLRIGNIQLTNLVQEAVNNLKTQYNEIITTQPNATGRITKGAIEQDQMGESKTSELSQKQQEAEATAAGKTSNANPAVEQNKDSLEDQTVLTENAKQKVKENDTTEDDVVRSTETVEGPVSENQEKLEIVEATSGKKSGQTSQEQSEVIVTEDNPTTTTIRALQKTYPQAWNPQFFATMSQFGEYQNIVDSNGNLIEILESPTGKASNLVFLDELTGPQLEALENGDPKFLRLYVFKPLLNQSGKVSKEGTKVLETEELVEFQMKRGDKVGPAVRVQIKDDAVKVSDIFNTKLLNSPELGVGTNVILRIEKNWPYFTPVEPGQGIVTIRLASNPDIILSQLSSSQKAKGTNGVLRQQITKFLRENPGKTDIKATIAGKTAGYFMNIKHDGKSIQQPISILGDDILLGVDLGGQGINWNNTNENNFESEYTEPGRVYARIKSANGIGHPVRLQTNTLSDDAARIILDTLISNQFTAEEKGLLVEQLVYIPRGNNADAQFKLGNKTSKTFAAKFDLSMDNFVIKFPFRGKVIGIQYNMEGREGNTRNNLQSALEGGEFLYKEYDEQGNIVAKEGDIVATNDMNAKRNTLRNSNSLELAPTEIRDALIEHLKSKVYNIQKHKINTTDSYLNPLRDQAFSDYNSFLKEMNILSTDIPGKGQQRISHSRLFLEVEPAAFSPSEKVMPEGLNKDEIKLIPVPESSEEDYVVERSSTDFSDLIGKADPVFVGNELPSHLVEKVNNALQMEEFSNIYNNLVDRNLSKEAASKPSYIKVMDGESADGFTQIVIFTDSDVIGYAEVDLKQNIMGGIKIADNAQRLGIATRIYEHLISQNILLESSHAQRPAGKALWQSLLKKGLATKISEDKYGPVYQLVQKTEPVKKVDPTKDDDFDIKLRQYENIGNGYDLMTETEKNWVTERFGEEALDVVNRVKYMTLKDGRQAWGYYHQGLMTVAEGALAGTAYWEAFRRIYDLHLTEDEKSTVELEAIEKYGQNADIETKLAEAFKDYMLTENDTGFGSAIKRFFRELWYQIKNMLGMRSEIEYLFRDLNNREFTQYTAAEAKEMSEARAPKLREKRGYNSDQTKEIVKNINYKLAQALKAKYKETDNPQGWKDALTKPNELKGAYESIRQQWETTGKRLSESEDVNTQNKGTNALNATKPDVWYDVVDEYGNVISPGFQSLAVRGLRSQFGVKYKIKKGGEINYNNPEIEEELTDEQIEQVDSTQQGQERIFGQNYYNSPVKQTLANEIKFELGFIVERNANGEVIYGEVLGMPQYMAFDEVYAYLSINLANSPQGKVIAKLEQLAENGLPMMDQVLRIYQESTPQWKNKFVSHFNKQNIRFETVIYQKDGTAKIVETNRNGLENQIIRKWVDTRDQTEIYAPVTGKEDALNPNAVDILKESYDLTTLLSREGATKEEYLKSFKNTLDYAGIRLSPETYVGLMSDETVTVRDLNSYMVGNSSFEHIMKTLMQFNNPYLKGTSETGALKRLASLESTYRIDSYAASFLGGNRKPIYSINLNTYDSKATLELRSDETYREAILNRFRDVFYSPSENNRHLILNMLLNDEQMRNNFQLSTFDVIREAANAGKVSAYDEMDQSLSALTRFIMFYNSGLNYSKFNTGTKGDKNQSKYITLPKIGPRSKYWKSGALGREGYIETAVKLLMPAVLGELARISKTNKQLFGANPISIDEQIQYLHYEKVKGDNKGAGLRFVQFPSLNIEQFFNAEGKLRENETMELTGEQNALIKSHLEKYVIKEMESTIEALVESGVVTQKPNGAYENLLLPSQSYEGKTTAETGILPALQEFAINDLVYKPYINTTFGPDLAYYKSDAQGNPFIEFGKRAYQSITPGIDAVYNQENQYGLPSSFSHAILADVYVNSEDHILKILADANVDSRIAKRIAAGYLRVNSTDAQGYTTMEFHKKQMESDGSWTDAHTEAYEKYWSKGLMGDAKARTLLLDPRKTYYFGERVVTDSQGNESIVWEQIKHSTIPLLREFTEQFKEDPGNRKVTLNQLRIRMEDKSRPIDMVNFESAIKIGASGILDLSTQDLNLLPVNILETRHLRSPQTIETKTKNPLDGTQMAKLSLANVMLDAKYNMFDSSISGKEVLDLYNNAYAERIKRSSDALSKRLGVSNYQDAINNRSTMTPEAFGKAQLEFLKKVRDEITNSLDERDLADNYYNALNIERLLNDVNVYGFEAPLSFPPFAKRFEAILLSMYKNAVLKQRFNGMSAVQVAEFGYNIDNRLQIKPHKNGGVYAEIALPYELAVQIGLKPGEVIDGSDIYDLLGYRIPTQGKNSMLSLKVVKILPENMGSVIMLPAEVTTMMGSDFDIDKMYILMPELSKQNTKISAFDLEKYNAKKSFDGLSDAALTNIIFDIRNGIITSKHHVVEQLDPLDSPTYTNKLNEYESKGIIPNLSGFNSTSFAADLYLEKINKDAGMLIGIFSLHATGHSIAQQVNLKLKEGYEVNIKGDNKNSHNELNKIEGFDGKFISSYLSEDQNESLDNAKYQRIGRVGVTVYNSGVVALLNRAGFNNSITLDFINQPILRAFFMKRYKEGPEVTDLEIAKNLANTFNLGIEFDTARELGGERIFTPSANYLSESLVANLNDPDIARKQIQLLADYLRYSKAGRDLGMFNSASSPETIKNMSRLSFIESYNNKVNYLEGPQSSLEIEKKNERIDAYQVYGLNAAVDFVSEFVPYSKPGFTQLKESIAFATGQRNGILTPELTEVINGLGLFWSLTKGTSPFGSMIYENSPALKEALFTKEKSLLKEMERIKAQYKLQNDPFLGMLFGHEQNINVDNFLQLISFNNTTKLGVDQLNTITDRWAELLVDPRDEVRVLAQNLAKYAVFTSGFMMGPNSFVDLVPMSYWKSSGLTDFFRKEERTMSYENYFGGTAAEQIIRNMYADNGFLMTVDNKTVETSDAVRKNYSLSKNEYFVHNDKAPQLVVDQIDGSTNNVTYFKSFMENKFRLFKLRYTTQTGAVYQEITPLGERFKQVEMQADNLDVNSINPMNTLIHEDSVSNEITLNQMIEGDETSFNDLVNPRLATPVKEAVLNNMDQMIEQWLMENFGIPVLKYDNLKAKLGIDAVGVADMLNRVVRVDNDRDRFTLPEEAGHFFVEMMENAPMERLLNLVVKTKTYQEVQEDYKHIYNNPKDFAKEAAGKILGKYIVGEYTGQTVAEDYGTGLLATLAKVWDAIKRFFGGKRNDISSLNKELSEILGPAADSIISGVNPGGLSIDNIGVNKFYALNKSNLEYRNAKGEKITPSDLLKRAAQAASSKVPYLRRFTEKDKMDKLIDEASNIIAPTEISPYYEMDGVKMNRVSQLMEIFQDPFRQQEIATKIAAKNANNNNPFNTPDKVQDLWDFLRDDMGTGLHTLVQGIIQKADMEVILDGLPQGNKEAFRNAIPSLREWVRSREAAGSTLYSEVIVGDKEDLIAGSVDVIEVTSNGQKILHDFKTKTRGKFGDIMKKLPPFKGALSGIQNNLFNKYRIQLSLYKHIIEQKGIKVDKINIVPIEADVSMTEEGKIVFANAEISTSTAPVMTKLNNLEPIPTKTLNKMIEFIAPNHDTMIEQSEHNQVLKVFQKAKNQLEIKINMYSKEPGSTAYGDRLQEVFNEMEMLNEKEGLVLFVKRAVADLNSAHKRLNQLKKDDALNAKVLSQILTFVGAFSSLEEITLMAPLLAQSGYENLLEKYVMPAIAKRDLILEDAKGLNRAIISEKFANLTTNPEYKNNPEKFMEELEVAGGDITFLARFLDALGDSNDPSLALIDKMVTIQRGKVNRFEYDFEHGKGQLMDALTNLEKFQHSNGVSIWKYRELYDFMLEQNKEGNLTGYVITEYMPEFKEASRNFIETKTDQGYGMSDLVWNEFYEEDRQKNGDYNKYLKTSPEGYKSEKYKQLNAMQESDPRRVFYNFFASNYEAAQSKLPQSYQRGYMLPSLRATLSEKTFMNEEHKGFFVGPYNALKEKMGEMFGKQEDNIMWGEYTDAVGDPMSYVPVHYSTRIGNAEGQLSPSDLSYDLASMLKMYTTMAANYQEMSEVLPELEMAKELVRTRRVKKLKMGMPIENAITGEHVTIAGEDSRAWGRLEDYFNMIIYGKRKKHEGVISLGGKEINTEQVYDSLLNMGSLRVLAMNDKAAVANITFGSLMNAIEAWAGEQVTMKNWTKAKGIYLGYTSADSVGGTGIIADTLSRSPKSKLGQINQLFDVNQHFDEYGRRLSHRKMGLRMNTGALYFMMSAGEHMIQSQLAIGMMIGKTFETSKGTTNLWKAYDVVDGKLVLDPEVESQFSETDRILFAEKIQATYQRMHGIYNNKDKAAIQQYAAGRWALQFRKWLRPGYLRRFEGGEKLFYHKDSDRKGPNWNERRQSYSEGNYVTALKFIGQLTRDFYGLQFFTLTKNYKDLAKWQQANIKRSIGEVLAFQLLTLAGWAFFGSEDEPDERSRGDWYGLYTMKRVQAELTFYNPLGSSFYEILRTPAANMTTLEAYAKLARQIWSDGWSIALGGDYERYKRKTGQYEKGDPKINKYFRNAIPFKEWSTDPRDKIKFFDLK